MGELILDGHLYGKKMGKWWNMGIELTTMWIYLGYHQKLINGGQMGSVQKYINGTKLFAAPNKVGL